jgi:hypothetical protein
MFPDRQGRLGRNCHKSLPWLEDACRMQRRIFLAVSDVRGDLFVV